MGIIQKQGIQNTIITYFGILLGFFNLLVVQPFLLTPQEIGLTRVLFSFASLIAVFLPMGIANITVKFFPLFRNESQRHHGFFGFMLLFPLVGFIIVSLFLLVFKSYFIFQYSKESPLFSEFFDFIFPFSFILGLATVLNVYCFSIFRSSFPSFLNEVLIRVFSIIIVSVYYLKLVTLDQFVFLFVGIYGIQTLILLIYIIRVGHPSLIIDWKKIKSFDLTKMLTFGFLLSFASIASLGLKYLDSIMIAGFLPLSFVGIYSIAAFIPSVIEAPLNAFDKIATTKIASSLAINDFKEIKEIYYKSSRYMIVLGGLLFLGININIDYLLSFLPQEYWSGNSVVLIISVSAFFNMASGTNTSIIFNSDNYKYGAIILIFLALSAFLFNLIFIPAWGINGAAFATALAALLYNIIKVVFIKLRFNLQPFNIGSVYVLLLIFVCYFINKIIPDSKNKILNIIVHSGIITFAYTLIIYKLKLIPELFDMVFEFVKTRFTKKLY